MSISSELENLRTDLVDAYDTLETMGATLPTQKTTEMLSTTIETIPKSSTTGVCTTMLQKCQSLTGKPAGKWLVGTGNGQAVKQNITHVMRPYSLQKFLLLDAKTGEKIYESTSKVDFRDNPNLWVPIFRLTVQEIVDDTPVEDPQIKWMCLRFDEGNDNEWYICLMENFGVNSTPAELDSNKQYIMQRDATLIFSYEALGAGDEIELEHATLCLRDGYIAVDILPDDSTSTEGLTKCFLAENYRDFSHYCPVNINSDKLDELRIEYDFITYENDMFGYLKIMKQPIIVLSSNILDVNAFETPLALSPSYPIIW